ncbi:MAG: AglZ/HisF2 family acetamidino modification protein [Chitinophagaceae bacterium]|nr:AglZ/HisF2 family acetamidino modification protein [Chitinophagaceae bacterium]MCW5926330.1 AglZ/HisF2 family acetamidino modification protein [Chitinophagaceae bacterium]
MRRIRVIPILLLHKGGLVKSVRFKSYKYIGDPINAVKIFNEKEVDEIVVLDIDASRDKRAPNVKMIADIVGEAFIPVAYGGGITTLEEVKELFYNGIEKVVINQAAISNPDLITQIANSFGSQSVVVSIDVKKNILKGNRVYTMNGKTATGYKPIEFIHRVVNAGAGEILLNSIDRDGTYKGYDLLLLKELAEAVNVPLVIAGGASGIEDFCAGVNAGASAVAAGSMFVFQRPHNAVLITYPSQKLLETELYSRI